MDINLLFQLQQDYFASGVTKVVDFRLGALRKLRRALVRNQYTILGALEADLGKSTSEGYMTELGLVLEEISHAERNLSKWAKPKRKRSSLAQLPGKAYSLREPYGVVLIMAPWNYPFMLTMSPLVGAIAAGNCCILKPANASSATSQVIYDIISKIFPSSYITVVQGGREENTELLDQPFDYIFFTGGKTVGKVVMEKAAVHVTPFTLELGGKSPCIVDETADLRLAAKRIIFGKLLNSGQTCVAPDYVLVQREVKQELLQWLVYWTETMWDGSPLDHRDYPHIVSQHHFERLLGLMEGSIIHYGGSYREDTRQISPTLLTDITHESPVMQEEIFGPLLPVIPYDYLNQAEHIVLEGEKPLALYIFTSDKRTQLRLLRNLSFGGGCINDTVLHMATPYMGFGGVGASGMGSYHGVKSFETFSHEKNILSQSTQLDIPLRYPPYRKWKDIATRIALR